jgi:hypothetical protein
LQECAIKPTKLGELNGDNQKTGTKNNGKETAKGVEFEPDNPDEG